jgi:hypothetical protein
MQTSLRHRLLLNACLVFILAGPSRAVAGLSLSLDSPTVTIPSTGDVVVDITGSAKGEAPNDQWSSTLLGTLGSATPVVGSFDSSGGIPSGTLLCVWDLGPASSLAPGTYTATIGLVDPGDPSTGGSIEAETTVTLVAGSPTPVPEPSTAGVAALGAVTFTAYGWPRRRRDQRRQAAA